MFRLRQILPNSKLFFRISPPSPKPLTITNVRHVTFKRPWIRKLFTTLFLCNAAFHLWSSFVLLQFDDTLDDVDATQEPSSQRGNVDENRGNGREETAESRINGGVDSDPIFIPLGWPQLREGELYAASDPEWQEFIKVSRDQEKLLSLKDELASIVRRHASQSKLLSHALGGPLTVTKFWLVHHFPSRAPPNYRRSGLEIAETGISWISRPMSLEDGDRLRRCMRPLYVALALKDAYLIFVKRKLSRLNIAVFGQDRAPNTLSLPSHNAVSSDTHTWDRLHPVPQPEAQVTPPAGPQGGSSQDKVVGRHHPSFIISTLQRLPLPKFGPGSDLYAASLAFRMRLIDCWARELDHPQRGAFYLSGPVGLYGPKGFCRIEVRGEYDPVAATWTSISVQLKDLTTFNRKALGGP
ncbi:hypothetical protein BDV28DRAFT_101656 [Aspergillus coremiiformis]|uniref:Uncharacterized protein n=1 Tax=Aspergillus coremiiformis TaxID=138285 RepID=A0A5N6YTK7_9EURO|nr:hypothetical protein BDV28DRAFT_101656 [Aspergillus coremiiformis]